MGYVQATIELSNPRQPLLHPLEVSALADMGALMLCIPEHMVVQLQLEQESLREVTVADGRVMQVPYVGPVRVAYQGRSCFVGALVLGDSVLLGAVPMEDMDLIVHPAPRACEGSRCGIGSTTDAARLKSESFGLPQSMDGRRWASFSRDGYPNAGAPRHPD